MINITLDGRFVEQVEPLTKEEMQEVLQRATIAMTNGKSYTYRLGQAIYNELPSYVAYPVNGSDQDMFHIRDEDLAITMLLNWTEKI